MNTRCCLCFAGVAVILIAGAVGCGPAPKGEDPPPPAAAVFPEPAAAAAAAPAPVVGQGPPRIELATRKYDMGIIPGEKPATGSIAVRNTGGGTLTIRQVSTSCGCTTGSLEQKEIPPGGEAPMTVVVNPAKIHGFESTKVLTIHSNDPENPRTMVEVSAKVKPEFLLEPEQLDFGKIAKGETATGRVVCRQASESPLAISNVKAWGAPPGLNVSLEKRPENEWAQAGHVEYVVSVALDTDEVPPGPYKAMFAFDTNVKRVPRHSCTVTADVVAPYAIKPRPLSLGLVQPGKSPAGTLVVSSDEPVSVTDVALTGTDLTAAPQPAPDGKSVAIEIAASSEAAAGSKREQMSFTVKVGEATFRERVPVTGVVTRNSPVRAAPPVPAPNQAP